MAPRNEASARHSELFGTDEVPLPQVCDGELLYSWCARFHRLSGNSKPKTTSRMLFGDPVEGLRHDLPARVDHFARVTRGHLGTAAEVIQERTQYALHAPFLDESARKVVIEAMQGCDRAAISRHLGLSRSGLATAAPLKACPVCLEEDRSAGRIGWWRMEHQWPTTYVCLEHRCRLNIQAMDSPKKLSHDWHLPSELRAERWEVAPTLATRQVEQLTHIAQWARRFLQRQEVALNATLLRHVYLLQAKAHGWLAMDGSLRFAALRNAFGEAHRGLETLQRWQFLGSVDTVNGGILGPLLRSYPGRRHPSKHVLLMAFLFEHAEEFYELYQHCRAIAEVEGGRGLERQLTDKQVRLIEMVKIEGKSVNASCLELEIPTAQGLKVLKKVGVSHHQRPRVTPEIKRALEKLLQAGTCREEIVKRLGVRKSFIKDYLAELPELRAQWEKALAVGRAARYREHFLKVLDENPGVPIKRIRRISGNGFEWLYRNDREWLIENQPGIWHRS